MSNKLSFNEQFIEISCERNDLLTHTLVGKIPYIHANRTLTKFRTTIRNIDVVLNLFRNIAACNIDTAPMPVQRLFEKEMHRRIYTKTLLELGPTGDSGWLWAHQQLGRELAEVNDRFAFFYDTRTGKTPMSLQIIADDVAKHPDHKWLILCPLILIENAWLEDSKRMFPDMSVVNLHDTSKAKRLAKYNKDANLYLHNIESFIDYREHIEKLPIYGCFVDESSTMKSSSSKFGKAAVEYSSTMKRWYLLSGSPAPNGLWEYYRQLQSVDYYGVHPSWAQFKAYFFNNVSRNPQYERLEIKAERDEELLKLLRGCSLYVDKEQVLETPGRDFIQVDLKMPDALAKQYDKLKKELYLELGDNVLITAPSTAAKLNKLNQVSSGFIIDTQAQETHLLSEYRFEELDKLLESIGNNQAIIWCTYKKEFEVLKRRLGDKCECVYGDVNITDKNINLKNFKAGKFQYLIANPASADKGLTLTNAHFAIYFSLCYSYELFKQSMERIYGGVQSQPNRCAYYILCAKGTVDSIIYTAVKDKGNLSLAILEHLKAGN